jgi:hypothetical protein
MARAIELLKKGFAALEKHVTERKATLEARLKKAERLDDADSSWLDGPANLIDEQQALELLDGASDYERGLSRLVPKHQAAVQRLKEFADGMKTSVLASKVPGAKRKSVCSPLAYPFHAEVFKGPKINPSFLLVKLRARRKLSSRPLRMPKMRRSSSGSKFLTGTTVTGVIRHGRRSTSPPSTLTCVSSSPRLLTG